MLNTLVQRRFGVKLHLLTPASPQEQSSLLAAGNVDLVHANPFDAVDMIRHQAHASFAQLVGKFDEMATATATESADLTQALIEWVQVDSFQATARLILKGEIRAGFFVAEAYASLTRMNCPAQNRCRAR